MAWMLLDAHAIGIVERRHVGDYDTVAYRKATLDFDRVDRGAAELYGDAGRLALVRGDLEDADRSVGLAEAGAAHVEHVIQPFERDRAVHRQVRAGALGERVVERDFDRDRSLDRRRIG